MRKLLIEPHYFGNLSYYSLINHFRGQVCWEVCDHYVKQTFRNRTVILSANGPLNLIIPVKYTNRTPVGEVTIDYSESWNKKHWRSIHSAYAKSPYFDYYGPQIEQALMQRDDLLIQNCRRLVTTCLEFLQIDSAFLLSETYQAAPESHIHDYRNYIHPKKPALSQKLYQDKPYFQNFGKEFVSNLSVLDLLFSLGPEAPDYLNLREL